MKFLKYLFVFLAVVLATSGLLIVTVWHRVTGPELYTYALQDSGVYEQVTEIASDYTTAISTEITTEIATVTSVTLTEAIIGQEVDERVGNILSQVLGDFLEENIQSIVSNIFINYSIQDNIERVVETSITSSLAWLRGDAQDPEIFAYIPNPNEAKLLEEQGVIKIITGYFIAESIGLTNLPECANTEQEQQNLYYLNDGRLSDVTCTSAAINPVLVQELENTIPVQLSEELQITIQLLLEEYNMTALLDTAYQTILGISTAKVFLEGIRQWTMSARILGIILLLASVPFAIFASVISEKHKLKLLIQMMFAVGLSLITIALIYLLMVPNHAASLINTNRIDLANEIITPARNTLFVQSLNRAVRSILFGVADFTMYFGVMLASFSGVFLLIEWVFTDVKLKNKVNKWIQKWSKPKERKELAKVQESAVSISEASNKASAKSGGKRGKSSRSTKS